MNDLIEVPATDVVKSCVKIRMYLNNFTLNARDCTVTVEKYDETLRIVDVLQVYITPEEYSQWAQDDDYIVDLVLTKLGYPIPVDTDSLPEEPVPEEPTPTPEEPAP